MRARAEERALLHRRPRQGDDHSRRREYCDGAGACRSEGASCGAHSHAAQVEDAVYNHKAIADCAAVPLPERTLGERVAVVCVVRPGEEMPSEEDVLAAASKSLAPFQRPEVRPQRALTHPGCADLPVLLSTSGSARSPWSEMVRPASVQSVSRTED